MFSNTRVLTVEWGHCDPAGIVFNPRFFEYFDWSTALLVAAATGVDKNKLLKAHGAAGIPLVDTRAVFRAPLRFGEEARIVSTVAALRGSSFDVEHKLYKGETLCVDGIETRVWTVFDDQGRIRARELPDAVRAALAAIPPVT